MRAIYVGRFAPSPTGPLHAGSLVAALASWLDARAHHGQWLVRFEDVDTPRCLAGMDRIILHQLADCGLHPDAPPVWQSQRTALYQQALEALIRKGLAYPCKCSRKEIEFGLYHLGQTRTRHAELIYPGTCRPNLGQVNLQAAYQTGFTWRMLTGFYASNCLLDPVQQAQEAINLVANNDIYWTDRQLGIQKQDVEREVGDFVLKRADGCFTYQLAVVVDDATQGVTDVVRGEDLADSTARQIYLQKLLDLPTPQYLHTPLVRGAEGAKLSKQNGAMGLDTSNPMKALNQAALVLGLPEQPGGVAEALAHWLRQWALF